jgi:hypothetical protein
VLLDRTFSVSLISLPTAHCQPPKNPATFEAARFAELDVPAVHETPLPAPPLRKKKRYNAAKVAASLREPFAAWGEAMLAGTQIAGTKGQRRTERKART